LKRKTIYLFLIILTLGGIFFSCEKETYINPNAARLAFSTDTVMFDTIFTTLGSTTQSFKVINPYNQPLLVSSIKLAGGDQSFYRLNIDGEMVNEARDIELRANDSIYIFVEVTINPNGVNQPMLVQDSVVFKIDGNLQDVKLMAYGQDFVPIKGETLKTTTWTANKPYVVFDSVIIDKQQLLTIEAGTKVYFHKNAYVRVFGAINAIGTPELPIIFQGDRLEKLYFDVPNQWIGIFIHTNPIQSVFENVQIKNGMVGLDLGDVEQEGGANVKLHNVKIEHMTFYGIRAIRSNIVATNTLIDDCGQYCLFLIVGGSYEFTHCTVANFWGTLSHRKTPSVAISNYGISDSVYYTGDLVKANWNNSIIWGNLDGSELLFADNGQNAFNYNFDHCLVKATDSLYNATKEHFIAVMGVSDNMLYADTVLFNDVNTYNFIPDTLSPIRNYGLRTYAEMVPFDLGNISRLADSDPDIGSYEYIYVKKEEEKKQ
jgi:hypothetical protein